MFATTVVILSILIAGFSGMAMEAARKDLSDGTKLGCWISIFMCLIILAIIITKNKTIFS